MRLPRNRRLAAPAALVLLLLSQSPASPGLPALSPLTRDLGVFGFPPSVGAAPGYVDDQACALCHGELSRAFAEKGMARAFAKPRPAQDVEDFGAPPFLHSASGQTMAITREGDGLGRLVFRRWQTGPDGEPINRIEIPVDWILGSGDHARTYLYRTPGGELYQLPLAWYSQTRRWGMAPGFDRPDHQGVLRRVRRECVFCHTAYPDVPAGADHYGAPQTFPAELPEGIGCQRCHGPGAEHLGWALGGIGSLEEIRASIFNPGRLPAEKKDEVCQGCHFQPSVVLSGLRRFGRGDFSFHAGEPLADYLVQVDVEEDRTPRSERFEINHHPYRLRQSRCFLESAGRLSCLTCHDPHRRVPEPQRVDHYRAACLSCHAEEACSRPEHGTAAATGAADCAGCHMPKRRTQDVVHVVMTDHRITRRPGGPELLARHPGRIEAELNLGVLLFNRGRLPELAEAAVHLERVVASRPGSVTGWYYLGEVRAAQGRPAEAVACWRRTLEVDPTATRAYLALGRALLAQGERAEALRFLRHGARAAAEPAAVAKALAAAGER
jgi:Tetratricopeptide repeat